MLFLSTNVLIKNDHLFLGVHGYFFNSSIAAKSYKEEGSSSGRKTELKWGHETQAFANFSNLMFDFSGSPRDIHTGW